MMTFMRYLQHYTWVLNMFVLSQSFSWGAFGVVRMRRTTKLISWPWRSCNSSSSLSSYSFLCMHSSSSLIFLVLALCHNTSNACLDKLLQSAPYHHCCSSGHCRHHEELGVLFLPLKSPTEIGHCNDSFELEVLVGTLLVVQIRLLVILITGIFSVWSRLECDCFFWPPKTKVVWYTSSTFRSHITTIFLQSSGLKPVLYRDIVWWSLSFILHCTVIELMHSSTFIVPCFRQNNWLNWCSTPLEIRPNSVGLQEQ